MQPSQRLVGSSNLSHAIKVALAGASYKTFADLSGLAPEELSIELSINLSQAQLICDCRDDSQSVLSPSATSRVAPAQSTPASILLATSTTRFNTLSEPLDHMIHQFSDDSMLQSTSSGPIGIHPGSSVEISGPPGSGKTAISIALALAAVNQQPSAEVLLIDTEGAITFDRLQGAAEALTRNTSESPHILTQGIHLLRIATQTQMIAMLHTMDGWLEQHPQVRENQNLSYHFRQPSMDMRTRARMMDLVKLQVAKATTIHKCAMICTNQLATKLLTAENKPANFDTGDRAVLMPQLGDSWTTSKTIRMVLFRGPDDLRYAHAASLGVRKDIPWSRYDIDHDGLPCNPIAGYQSGTK